MKTRTVLMVGGLVLAAGLGGWWWQQGQTPVVSWRTAELTRQDVRATVSSTGTLAAVTTVEVGTQVSGPIVALFADCNGHVSEGPVIARLDTSIMQADVDAARANLAVRAAEADKARADVARAEALTAQGATSALELADARTAEAVATAQVRAAKVSLDRATRNLTYATITSPVDGTVLSRDVELGQTVNAGMTAPKLFSIAGDLTRMQILVSVDESDIGRIHDGQAVEFTVQAYSADTFKGTVRQVRMQSTVSENVVTYTVVVDVDNADGRLLPGMTATVQFVVGEAKAVLCASNAALRFKPDAPAPGAAGAPGARPSGTAGAGAPAAAPAATSGAPAGAPAGASAATSGAPAAAPAAAAPAGPPSGAGHSGRGDGKGTVYTLDATSTLVPHAVKTGLTDGKCTEITADDLAEGALLVSGQIRSDTSSTSTSPFQPKSATGGGPRPGGF